MSNCPPSHTRAGEAESAREFAEKALAAGGHLADDVAMVLVLDGPGVILEPYVELAETLVSDHPELD